MNSICIKCGNKATEGSMKHPYCKKCFKEDWNNDIDKYDQWLMRTHI